VLGVERKEAGWSQEPLNTPDPRRLSFPLVTDPRAPPLRPERHIPNSIATLRRRLIVALVEHLPRCPCCGAGRVTPRKRNLLHSKTNAASSILSSSIKLNALGRASPSNKPEMHDLASPARGGATSALARHDHFEDAGRAIADFEPHDVAHPLLMGRCHRAAIVAEGQETAVEGIEGSGRDEGLYQRCLKRVRLTRIA
jgi:hypothetical protein